MSGIVLSKFRVLWKPNKKKIHREWWDQKAQFPLILLTLTLTWRTLEQQLVNFTIYPECGCYLYNVSFKPHNNLCELRIIIPILWIYNWYLGRLVNERVWTSNPSGLFWVSWLPQIKVSQPQYMGPDNFLL